MTKPRPSPALGAEAEYRLAVHALFGYVHTLVWGFLDRHRVPAGDRYDLVQDVVLDALRLRSRYRAEAGTPGQWLGGIATNHVRAYWRKRAREPTPFAELPDIPSKAPTPEDIVDKERLLSTLPPVQRRVVLFHEELGLNFREIAAVMGLSKSKVERLHKAALAALAATVEASGEPSADVASILAVASLDDLPVTAPPPEAVARAWERVVAEGLADDFADFAANLEPPPSSGPRPRGLGAAPPAPPSGPRRSSSATSRASRARPWERRGIAGLLMAAGVLLAAKLALDPDLDPGHPLHAARATASPPAASAASPADAVEPATPRPPPRAARALPLPEEVIALPHYPDRLAQVRERLWSARNAQLAAGADALHATCAEP
jgi:RNA polymerase sigma factor (sigma-70 family)